MKHRLGLTTLMILFIAPLSAQDSFVKIQSLRDIMPKLVELRITKAKELADWKEQKESLLRRMKVLEKEKYTLKKDIVQLRQSLSQNDVEIENYQEKSQQLHHQLDEVEPSLIRHEKALKKIINLIPDSLNEGLVFQESDQLSERIKNIIFLWMRIESLQKNLHLRKEILKTGDHSDREFDILYVGLSSAFCVSSDNQFAGVASLKEGQISWNWDHKLAPKVRNAVKMFQQKGVAKFINLPVMVQNGVVN